MPEKLRRGWTRAAFGDVVRQVRDRVDPENTDLERYVAGEHMDTDDLKICRWGVIGDGYLGPAFHMRFKPGNVLYGSRRTYLRKVAVADFEGITANTTFVLEPKDPKILLPQLLPFIMQTDSFHEHSIKQSKGSVNPYINYSDLAWYEFALPPLEEQRRIAEMLNAAEAAKRCFGAAARKLEETASSWLHEYLGRIKVIRPLGRVLLSTEYGSSTYADTDHDGTPILRIPNVLRGKLDLAELKWVQLPLDEIKKYELHAGDILIVRTNGNPDYVGRCLVVPELQETTVFASYLIRLIVDLAQVRPEYIACVLNSPATRRLLRGSVRSSAGNYNINTEGIRSIPVPIPAPDEQDQLLAELLSLSEAQRHLESREMQVNEIRRKLMENALR